MFLCSFTVLPQGDRKPGCMPPRHFSEADLYLQILSNYSKNLNVTLQSNYLVTKTPEKYQKALLNIEITVFSYSAA